MSNYRTKILCYAVIKNYPWLAWSAIKLGADIDVTTIIDNNRTPLYYAIAVGYTEMTKVLLEQGADPNARDVNNDTSLHLAVQKGDIELTKALLERGADPNAKNNDEHTPLYRPANLEMLKVLLEQGADPNTKDTLKNTILHHTARYFLPRSNILTVCKELLLAGVNPTLQNIHNKTAEDYLSEEIKENYLSFNQGIEQKIAEFKTLNINEEELHNAVLFQDIRPKIAQAYALLLSGIHNIIINRLQSEINELEGREDQVELLQTKKAEVNQVLKQVELINQNKLKFITTNYTKEGMLIPLDVARHKIVSFLDEDTTKLLLTPKSKIAPTKATHEERLQASKNKGNSQEL
ncbi:ankyrin repeat domain-containing protein [Rickettsiales endosymbiont of Stachyamoeba lipophora]|uniref:ankyrin repeat domain-containing protein n=1 Tax=Rickettsiales endosymbiont of Stachyamoeba lipophora TaxID=2486578 RepID=UPI0013DE2780|nr:ankyrin repeat domain-containing protein [Rickettsiales endosymbiont of Stachyamoeba lipophora]